MTWAVPLAEVTLSDADVEAYLDRLRSGWLTMGPSTQDFETAFASFLGTPHAVAVSSGSAALQLALLAAGIGSGDEVIVPAFTFVATANAVRNVGASPVLCDSIDPLEPTVDPQAVARVTTERTRAVIAAHTMGYPARVLDLRAHCESHSLLLIEDVSGAAGAVVGPGSSLAGTVGHVGTFSFRAPTQLALGEGGLVATADEALAGRVRKLRSHAMTSVTWDRHRGHAASYDVVDIGFNYRLDEPRAALGISRLERLEADLESRRAAVRRYRSRLGTVRGVALPWSDEDVARSAHAAFAIVLESPAMQALVRDALRAEGVQTTRHPTISELSAYREHRGASGFPNAESFAERHCVLPLSSTIASDRIDHVTDLVAAVASAT